MSSSRRGRGSFINGTGVFFGIALLIVFIGARIFSESPYETLYKIDPTGIIPPIWLLNLLSIAWSFLIGYSAGTVIDSVLYHRGDCNNEISAYRGGIFFVILFFLSHIWFSVFFSGEHLLISLLIILLSIISSAACVFFWSKILLLPSIIMGGYGLWLFYLFILNTSVVLHI